jgi:hypothetical protein
MGGAVGNFSSRLGNQGSTQGVAQYTPAQTRATYNPAFSSQQTAQPAIQGIPQQMAPQGLQGLMAQMMSRYQNPSQMQQRAPMPMNMPQYRSSALSYRPDIAGAQQNLSRIKPSVQKQEQDAQAARIAELEAQIAAQQQQSYYDYGGGAG